MASVTYDLRLNADGSLTVKVGRARESLGLEGKTKAEIFDAVKWALVSKDAFISDAVLTEDLYGLIWSGVEPVEHVVQP
jgi:hypothetical protein